MAHRCSIRGSRVLVTICAGWRPPILLLVKCVEVNPSLRQNAYQQSNDGGRQMKVKVKWGGSARALAMDAMRIVHIPFGPGPRTAASLS